MRIRSRGAKKFATLLVGLFVVGVSNVLACELCEKNQPQVLKGVTHGVGPRGDMDYIIIWTAVVFVSITLFLSLKFLIRPNENNPDHIKNIVLNPEY
jgi:hypothetical protein